MDDFYHEEVVFTPSGIGCQKCSPADILIIFTWVCKYVGNGPIDNVHLKNQYEYYQNESSHLIIIIFFFFFGCHTQFRHWRLLWRVSSFRENCSQAWFPVAFLWIFWGPLHFRLRWKLFCLKWVSISIKLDSKTNPLAPSSYSRCNYPHGAKIAIWRG